MKAAVLRSIPGELSIEEVELGPTGPTEARVRVVGSGLCHSDLHMLHGEMQYPLPAILGHEVAGVVEEVGEMVTEIAVGDHVIACPSIFCGACEFCLTGRPNLCQNQAFKRRPGGSHNVTSADGEALNQFANIGGFAEEIIVHAHALAKVDPEIPLDVAAITGCAVVTGLGAVFHSAKVEPGSQVAVFGAGGIGLNVIQGARIAGATRIIAIDLNPTKLELARSLGATETINPQEVDDVVEAVVELSGGGVHYSFEAIGRAETIEQAYAMLRRAGTAVVIGVLPDGVDVTIPGQSFVLEKRLVGCIMGSNRFRLDVPSFMDLYRQGRLELDALISQRISLDQISEGYAALERGETARSVIVFD